MCSMAGVISASSSARRTPRSAREVELALECMKTDGALAKIHEKWFGVKPDATSSMAKVYPGTGAPDFEGYDATEHKLECK